MHTTKLISWTTLVAALIGAILGVVLISVGFLLSDWQFWLLYLTFAAMYCVGMARGYADGSREKE